MKLKIAIVGSRGLTVDIANYIPPQFCGTVISGGAKGIDSCAREFAKKYDIPLKEFLPRYEIYGRRAPLVRNKLIIDEADIVVGFWDGQSTGTMHAVNYARKMKKPVKLYRIKTKNDR